MTFKLLKHVAIPQKKLIHPPLTPIHRLHHEIIELVTSTILKTFTPHFYNPLDTLLAFPKSIEPSKAFGLCTDMVPELMSALETADIPRTAMGQTYVYPIQENGLLGNASESLLIIKGIQDDLPYTLLIRPLHPKQTLFIKPDAPTIFGKGKGSSSYKLDIDNNTIQKTSSKGGQYIIPITNIETDTLTIKWNYLHQLSLPRNPSIPLVLIKKDNERALLILSCNGYRATTFTLKIIINDNTHTFRSSHWTRDQGAIKDFFQKAPEEFWELFKKQMDFLCQEPGRFSGLLAQIREKDAYTIPPNNEPSED